MVIANPIYGTTFKRLLDVNDDFVEQLTHRAYFIQANRRGPSSLMFKRERRS